MRSSIEKSVYTEVEVVTINISPLFIGTRDNAVINNYFETLALLWLNPLIHQFSINFDFLCF
jgi:hypothetical protein